MALDAQGGLRDDLRVLAMSATLDGGRFATLLGDAPIVASEGRTFPVETRYLGHDAGARVEDRVARAVATALAAEEGSLLAFLPGQAEIRRTVERLEGRVPADVVLAPLFGAMDPRAQDTAIRPAAPGSRKVVLATAIAETSLTIEGVRVVVDSGLARRPRYDPGSGLSRLETVRVSRAAADQRRGRAGRTAPGICYRLWDEPETASLLPFDRPEILDTDLGTLALTLLAWGARDPSGLRWLDPPPAAAWGEAIETLSRLGAFAASGGLSSHGRRLADLPLPPRLAHLVLAGAAGGAARLAAEVAAILSEPGLGGRDTDLRHRLAAFRRDASPGGKAARQAAERWARAAPSPLVGEGWGGGTGYAPLDRSSGPSSADLEGAASLLALAFPERIAQARGAPGRFRLANGRGARLDETDALAREAFLAVGEVQGGGPDSRILLAAPITRAGIEELFADRIGTQDRLAYDPATDAVSATRVTRLDALVHGEIRLGAPAGEPVARLLAAEVVRRGLDALPWPDDLRAVRARVAFLRRHDGTWPDLSDAALAASAEDWLVPAFAAKRRLADLSGADLRGGLAALLPWARMADLDRLAPPAFAAPSGKSVPIDYAAEEPIIRIAVQNLFGIAQHPAVMAGRVPLVFELLSPAGRPIQVTRDLPAFWRGTWRDVRAELRGRYPKHSWPEDPAIAAPLTGAKRRPQ